MLQKTLDDFIDQDTGAVVVELKNGYTIASGWCDKDDPDCKPAGDYIVVHNHRGQQLFYAEAVDFTTWDTMTVQRKLRELIAACLGVPPQ